ncbi:hypothetical protein GF339_23995 [candidate division KSB3 bacterium]|uniref:Smf/DprA SLOG domain-containing protein n=1 Tax=candidate division KSB3 bacterium TaxID=2044937 RepID=A0A9D5K1T3_9BACT|nr:hypothetical protein [candidate division KSB3 bacterium]MBD3327667.1 hypothetical protein [candidate division KSB3 bacterium]
MRALQDAEYWIALAHIPGWPVERIQTLITDILDHRGMTLAEFFECTPRQWQQDFAMTARDVEDLTAARTRLPQCAALVRVLLKQGIELVPFLSPAYPQTLRSNLPPHSRPPLLYLKGDARLLDELSTAIVGSPAASQVSQHFATAVAANCIEQGQVVAARDAKGLDRLVLDTTLQAGGKGLLILSQGILKGTSGLKRYAEEILAGNLLVLSCCAPKHPRERASRLPQIRMLYGLVQDVYIPEIQAVGDLWTATEEILNQGRTVYVRSPSAKEKTANALLIQHGAIPVDQQGTPVAAAESSSKNRWKN